jgi:homospermidine synthase
MSNELATCHAKFGRPTPIGTGSICRRILPLVLQSFTLDQPQISDKAL